METETQSIANREETEKTRKDNSAKIRDGQATVIRRRTEIVTAYNGKSLKHSRASLAKSEQLPFW